MLERTDLLIRAHCPGEFVLFHIGPRQQRLRVEASADLTSWLTAISLRIKNPDGTGSYKHLFGRVRLLAFGCWRSMSTNSRTAAGMTLALPDKPLDKRPSSVIALQDMELTAKSPRLLDWFPQDGPAHIAELDLGGAGADSRSCTGRTIPE